MGQEKQGGPRGWGRSLALDLCDGPSSSLYCCPQQKLEAGQFWTLLEVGALVLEVGQDWKGTESWGPQRYSTNESAISAPPLLAMRVAWRSTFFIRPSR